MRNINIVLAPEFKTYAESLKFHEAGFDSYITGNNLSYSELLGYCFAKMLNILTEEELHSYQNRLYAFKSYYYIDLINDEVLNSSVKLASKRVLFIRFLFLWENPQMVKQKKK